MFLIMTVLAVPELPRKRQGYLISIIFFSNHEYLYVCWVGTKIFENEPSSGGM